MNRRFFLEHKAHVLCPMHFEKKYSYRDNSTGYGNSNEPCEECTVFLSDASDKDGGGATLRCKHGTDIVNHAPCGLCELEVT